MIAADLINLPMSSNRHQHGFHQLVVGVSGRTEFEVNGLGNCVDRWQGCVVPADFTHGYCGDSENRVLVLNVLDQGNDLLNESVVDRLFNRPGYFNMDVRLQQMLQLGIQEIQHYPNDHVLTAHIAATFIHGLLNRLDSADRQLLPRSRVLDREQLDEFIDRHIGQAISVFQLAEQVHLSASHFQRLFKESTGMTPHQYVLSRRLQTAHHLLSSGQQLISDIADSCGFSSQSALTSCFKRRYGLTPGQLRR